VVNRTAELTELYDYSLTGYKIFFFSEQTSEALRPSIHTAARLRAVSLPPNTSLPRGGPKILINQVYTASENGQNGRCSHPNGVLRTGLFPRPHGVHRVEGDTPLQVFHHLLDDA
jgi:hypothetical protein